MGMIVISSIFFILLSILIPTYNKVPDQLVRQVIRQLSEVSISFEIIIGDDASPDRDAAEEMKLLEQLAGVKVHRNQVNMGRAGNRNSLASLAQYPNLLYIDGDSGLVDKNYIKNYLACLEKYDVVYGGRIYSQSRPDERKYWLKWSYAMKYEVIKASIRAEDPYRSFGSNNFMVRHELIQSYPFDESIKTYGYEDSMWASLLRVKGVRIEHIDNPTFHLADIPNRRFLQKTKEALRTLKSVEKKGIVPEVRLVRVASTFMRPTMRILLFVPFLLLSMVLPTVLILFPRAVGTYQLFKLAYYVTLSDRC